MLMDKFYDFIKKSRCCVLLLVLGCIGMLHAEAQLGVNLIVNGDAENPPVIGNPWVQGGTDLGGPWYLPGNSTYPTPLPPAQGGGQRGAHGGGFFFSAGTDFHLNDPAGTLTQLIDVSTLSPGSNLSFSFSSFVATDGFDAGFGGDIVEITIRYMDASMNVKQFWDTTWQAEDDNDYAWHNLTHTTDIVPSDNVSFVQITLSAQQENSSNVGPEVYYDDLSLVANLTILPIDLLDFTAVQRTDHTVGLAWQTGLEENSHYIDIERSGDGKTFSSIGQVPAAGNSHEVRDYSFVDASPFSGNNFYRLKLVDLDGKFKYSKVLVIRPTSSDKTIEVFSNPFHDQIGLRIAAIVPDRLQLSLMDAAGRICLRQSVNMQSGNNFIDLYPSAGMAAGLYFLRIQGSHTDQTIRVLKQ
jgi:hypothetical protein